MPKTIRQASRVPRIGPRVFPTKGCPTFLRSIFPRPAVVRANVRSLRRTRRPAGLRPAIDRLESRLALAIDTLTIGGVENATFLDADNDSVGVFITGSAGTAVFRNSSGQPVQDGEDIASISITAASSDFTLGFLGTAAGGSGNTVQLGEVTATSPFAGIYTTSDETGAMVYNLTSFAGVNFTAGGGLFVDYVAPNGAVTLTGGLARDASVVVRQSFGSTVDGSVAGGAGLTLGTSNSKIEGTLQIQRIPRGDSVLSQVTFNGSPSSTFVFDLRFGGTIDMASNGIFRGTIQAGSQLDGNLVFNGGIATSAVLQAQRFTNTADSLPAIQVFGDIAGTIMTYGSDLEIDTITGSVLKTARLLSANQLEIADPANFSAAAFAGSVKKGATLSSFSHSLIFCEGDFSGNLASSGSGTPSTLAIGGSLKGASITNTGEAVVSVAGSITKGTFLYVKGDLSLAVGGSVSGKTRLTSHDGSISATIAGSLTDGRLVARDAITASVGGRIDNVRIDTASRLISVSCGGSVTNSRIVSSNSSISLTVAGSLTRSRVVSSDDNVFLTVGGNALDNQILTDLNIEATIGGDFRGSLEVYNGGFVTVGGSVLRGSFLNSAGELRFLTRGNFDGSLTAENARIEVLGNVGKAARFDVKSLAPFSSDGPFAFFVGGNFAGQLNVVTWSATFNPEVTTATIVEGNVTSSGRITVAGQLQGEATIYRFGGNMDGVLTIASFVDELNSKSLVIEGNAKQIVVGGPVIFETVISGTLTSMAAGGSVFIQTSEASGLFLTGASEAMAGSLTAGRFARGSRTVKPNLGFVT